MKEDIAVHKARIKSFQMTVLVSMVFVMVGETAVQNIYQLQNS